MKLKKKTSNGEARSQDREERREQILGAARTVFAERGYHQATVSEMVKRCGVAQGTFYLYFQSKREVFEALLDQFVDSVFHTFFLPGAEIAITQEEIWSRLVVISNWAVEVFWRNHDLARLFLLEAPAREPGCAEKIDRVFERLIEAAAANLQSWMDKGLLQAGGPPGDRHLRGGHDRAADPAAPVRGPPGRFHRDGCRSWSSSSSTACCAIRRHRKKVGARHGECLKNLLPLLFMQYCIL